MDGIQGSCSHRSNVEQKLTLGGQWSGVFLIFCTLATMSLRSYDVQHCNIKIVEWALVGQENVQKRRSHDSRCYNTVILMLFAASRHSVPKKSFSQCS